MGKYKYKGEIISSLFHIYNLLLSHFLTGQRLGLGFNGGLLLLDRCFQFLRSSLCILCVLLYFYWSLLEWEMWQEHPLTFNAPPPPTSPSPPPPPLLFSRDDCLSFLPFCFYLFFCATTKSQENDEEGQRLEEVRKGCLAEKSNFVLSTIIHFQPYLDLATRYFPNMARLFFLYSFCSISWFTALVIIGSHKYRGDLFHVGIRILVNLETMCTDCTVTLFITIILCRLLSFNIFRLLFYLWTNLYTIYYFIWYFNCLH